MDSICPFPEENEKYAKLKMRVVSLEDRNKYSLAQLKNNKEYGLINPNSRHISYLHVDEIKHAKLIYDIKCDVKGTRRGIQSVHDYFNKFFCVCEFGCRTFLEENGFYYIERHHLVEQNLIDKHKNIEELNRLINDIRNKYSLCPNCHMKIHHGKIDDRKKMIRKLYLKNKTFYDSNFNVLKGDMDSLTWLYSIYKCNKP